MTETEVKTKKTFKFKGKELSRYEYIKVPVYLPIQVTIMIYTPNKGFFSSICHEILKKKKVEILESGLEKSHVIE